MEVSCELKTRVLYPFKKKNRYRLNRRLGGPQSRYRRFGDEKNILPLSWFESRTIQSVAWSLYKLSYPTPLTIYKKSSQNREDSVGTWFRITETTPIVLFYVCVVLFVLFYACVILRLCSMYCLCRLCYTVYCFCVNMYCTTATGCQPNCS
jgi:hypothetical protein